MCAAKSVATVQVKGIAHPIATYAVIGPKRPEQVSSARLRLELEVEGMSDDERKAAADTLRRALGLLEKDNQSQR
jgi:hypothetical protein